MKRRPRKTITATPIAETSDAVVVVLDRAWKAIAGKPRVIVVQVAPDTMSDRALAALREVTDELERRLDEFAQARADGVVR